MGAKRDKLTREYATDEIVVEWEPRLCYHSQNCVRSLPQVFDDSRRPWVEVDAASADEVEAAVARCPSGALRTRRLGSAASTQQPEQPTVRASENGPLLVSGGVRVLDAEGAVLCRRRRQPSLRGRTRGALSLRGLEQQAVLRRDAQEERLPWLTPSDQRKRKSSTYRS